jgi:glycosyltransferase involved in cell wall biosynthesis
MMKISMLTSVTQRCGVYAYVSDLSNDLRKHVDLTLVPVWDRIEPWDQYLSRSSQALNDSDLVHIQHEYAFWGSVLPGRNKYFSQISSIKRPIVLTAHTLDHAGTVLGLDLPGSFLRKSAKRILAMLPSYRRVIERDTFEVGDRIIIHDLDAAARLKSRGIPEAKIRIIPMGVPAAGTGPDRADAFRSEFGLHGRRLIVVFGFVRPGRGYEDALGLLGSLGSDVTLVIAGGPQTDLQQVYLDSFMALVKARGLSDRVTVTGFLPGDMVPGAMQAADVVLCSQEAGTGSYSVQIALAYGRPIVASDLPCFTYPEQTHGCLVTFKRADSRDMAAKLKAVLTDSGLSAGLSARASHYAADHTWDKIAEKTVAVYQELMSDE